MDTVDSQSQVGESLRTGVGLSSVYAASEAKVEKSVCILVIYKYADDGKR
jgi:hypothetical protein